VMNCARMKNISTSAKRTLEELQDDISKKERMLESMQAETDRTGQGVEARDKELEKIIKQEQDPALQISSLDQKAATDLLLDRLDRQLKSENGALIYEAEQEVKQQRRNRRPAKSSGWPFSGTRRATLPKQPSPPSTFPTTK